MLLKILWSKRLVWHAHQNDTLNEGQAGSRQGRNTIDIVILKEMKFAPRDRTAYFSKFTTGHWRDWEAKYKATFSQVSVAHKTFIPEIVEVAPSDVALSGISHVLEILKKAKR